ncbi:unnamed protein product [Mytilus coruscus]|uniref:Uncharacterized protein n=1 Tax=Mytilus coruscus TaxID=42192 RepID=A0A6J8CBY7_MYTCO|nr:unnamed protein product [Mytilus coruscus]
MQDLKYHPASLVALYNKEPFRKRQKNRQKLISIQEMFPWTNWDKANALRLADLANMYERRVQQLSEGSIPIHSTRLKEMLLAKLPDLQAYTKEAHPIGMTNNSFSGGHNLPIASAPVTNGKRSSSLSSLSSSLKLASNAFEMAGNLGEIGGSECREIHNHFVSMITVGLLWEHQGSAIQQEVRRQKINMMFPFRNTYRSKWTTFNGLESILRKSMNRPVDKHP